MCKDNEKALEWYLKSADHGNGDAQHFLEIAANTDLVFIKMNWLSNGTRKLLCKELPLPNSVLVPVMTAK